MIYIQIVNNIHKVKTIKYLVRKAHKYHLAGTLGCVDSSRTKLSSSGWVFGQERGLGPAAATHRPTVVLDITLQFTYNFTFYISFINLNKS